MSLISNILRVRYRYKASDTPRMIQKKPASASSKVQRVKQLLRTKKKKKKERKRKKHGTGASKETCVPGKVSTTRSNLNWIMTQRLLKKEETGEAGVESSKARTDPETAFSGL